MSEDDVQQLANRAVRVGDNIEMTAIGAKIADGASVDECADAVNRIDQLVESTQWAKGDLLAFMDRKYGDLKRICEERGWNYGSARMAAHVSQQIELLRRRNNLSWSIHREAASLKDPDLRAQALDRAEREGLSVRALRREVKRLRSPDPPQDNDVDPHLESEQESESEADMCVDSSEGQVETGWGERESEIYRLHTDGRGVKEIADELGLTVHQVQHTKKHIGLVRERKHSFRLYGEQLEGYVWDMECIEQMPQSYLRGSTPEDVAYVREQLKAIERSARSLRRRLNRYTGKENTK